MNKQNSTEDMRRSAVLPSPPDARDYGLCMAMDVANVDIPKDFEVWQPPVEKQYVNNCVAQVLANIAECIDHRDGLEHKDRSVGYIYGTREGMGMYPREACAAYVKDGDLYRSVWECLEENPECYMLRQKIPQSMKELAKKPLMYIRLNTKEELQLFMLRYGLPVLISGETKYLGSSWSTGRHAVTCRGWISEEKWEQSNLGCFPYKDIHFTNSWGTGGAFGDGTGYVNFENLEEVWGIVPMEKIEFKDVDPKRWSAKAIEEAVEAGIIKGYPDNTFRPDAPITREEVAVLFARFKHLVDGNNTI